MEVTCERCKAEYDFDDSLVGASGTTVKCTDCGHVFKVLPSASSANRGNLQIRFRDGRVEQLASLRELQRRAKAGEISLQDEIGRDGYDWRPLHTVAELRGFFQPADPAAAQGAGPAVSPAAAAHRTMHGVGPGFGVQPTHPNPVAPGAPVPGGFQAQPSAAPPSAMPPSNPARAPAATPPPGPLPAPAPQASLPPGLGSAPAPFKAPSPASRLYLDEDDATEVPARRRMAGGGSMRWIGLGVLVAGGAWFGINAMNTSRVPDEEPLAAAPLEADAGAPAPDASAADAATKPDAESSSSPTAATTPPAPKDTPAKPSPEEKSPEEKSKEARKETPRKASRRAENERSEAKSRRARRSREREPASPAEASYGQLIGHADRLLEHKDYRKAQAMYEQALEKRSGGSEANSGLGFALLGQGRAGKAIPYLEKAARNGFAVASIGLGDANAKLGRGPKAVEAYQEYLQRLPNGSKAGYAKKRIAALERSAEPAAPPRVPEAPPEPPGEEEPQPDDGEEYVPAGAMEEATP